MKTWMKILLVTLLVGIPAVPLGQMIWQAPMAGHDGMATAGPDGVQLGLLIVFSVFEGLAFGLGVAFLLFGYPMVQRFTGNSRTLATATYLSIAWWLISWWPHDNLHRTMGNDYGSLLAVEYGFHLTLMIGAAVTAYAFVKAAMRLNPGPVGQAAELRSAERYSI